MKTFIASAFVMFCATALSACGGMSLKKYETQQPEMSIREYFDGEIQAWGIIQDRSGNVISRFDIDLVGTWDGNQGVLEEDFRFYDGKTDQRTWYITDLGNGTYEGRADDIIGVASSQTTGNAANWAYSMDVTTEDGSTYRLKFDDWMWLMNDGVLMNRSYMKKFGITFGELTIFMKKKM